MKALDENFAGTGNSWLMLKYYIVAFPPFSQHENVESSVYFKNDIFCVEQKSFAHFPCETIYLVQRSTMVHELTQFFVNGNC